MKDESWRDDPVTKGMLYDALKEMAEGLEHRYESVQEILAPRIWPNQVINVVKTQAVYSVNKLADIVKQSNR